MIDQNELSKLTLASLAPSSYWRCYQNHVAISSQTWANDNSHTLWYIIHSVYYTDVHKQAIMAEYLQRGKWKQC